MNARGRIQRPPLRRRQSPQPGQERDKQLVQRGETEIHLGLDTGDSGDTHTGCRQGRVVKQRCLADPGFAPQHQGTAQSAACGVEHPVERSTLRQAI